MSLWIWLLPITIFITFGLTWFIYVAVMRLQTVWDGLHPVVKAIAVPPAIIGYVLDVVWVNWCLPVGVAVLCVVPMNEPLAYGLPAATLTKLGRI